MAERLDGRGNEPRIISPLEAASLNLFKRWVTSIMSLPNAQVRSSFITEAFLRHLELTGITDTNMSRLNTSTVGLRDIFDRPVMLRKESRTPFDKLDRLVRSRAVVEVVDKVEYNIYVYDPMSRELEIRDLNEKVHLTKKEGGVFSLLISLPERVINYRTIRDFVWPGVELDAINVYSRVFVRYLRQKIHDFDRPTADWHIKTVQGEGYLLRVGLGTGIK